MPTRSFSDVVLQGYVAACGGSVFASLAWPDLFALDLAIGILLAVLLEVDRRQKARARR